MKIGWNDAAPVAALALMAAGWALGSDSAAMAGLFAAALAVAVLAAVHHAEVVAHRVGEPFGTLVLAVAVTVIEVALNALQIPHGKGGTEAAIEWLGESVSA